MTDTTIARSTGPGPLLREVAAAGARVRVFEYDEALLDGVPLSTARRLASRVLVPRLRLGVGAWDPTTPRGARGVVLGALVLDGLLERTVDVSSRAGPELLGPGDVVRPWDPDAECSWEVHERVDLAVLDDRFTAIAGRIPRVLANLLGRTTGRSHALAARLAIGQVRSAEERVLLVLAGVAERWGCTTERDGTRIPFALRHDTIGRLACMRRPTTSTALATLQRSGRLVRCADGTWLLPVRPVDTTAAPVTDDAMEVAT